MAKREFSKRAWEPSIKFVPKLRKYETIVVGMARGNAADGRRLAADRIEISHSGYMAKTEEEENFLLQHMNENRDCGYCTYENREMPKGQKEAEAIARKAQLELKAKDDELEAMRRELEELRARQS